MHFTEEDNIGSNKLQQILAVEEAVGGGFGQMFGEYGCGAGEVGDGAGQPDDA